MKNYLKYVLTLFLVLSLTANEVACYSSSKSVAYDHCSFVLLKREPYLENIRLYRFAALVCSVKTAFVIPLQYLGSKRLYGLQILVVAKLCVELHQHIDSIVRQAVFVNEIVNSGYSYKSLYKA